MPQTISRGLWIGLVCCLGASVAFAEDAALVARINGMPIRERAGTSAPLRQGDGVVLGDVVVTDADAKVKLLLADDSVLAIGPRSRVVIDQLAVQPTSRTVQLRVLAGRFKVAIAKFLGGSSQYEIRTPTAVAGVRGTVLWGDTDLDAICALDGTIEVRPLATKAAATRLAAGRCVHRMAHGKTTPLRPSAGDLAAYLKEVTLD